MSRFLAAVAVGLVFLSPLSAQTPEIQKVVDERLQTVRYLKTLQTREGGFKPSGDARGPSLRATTSALRALKYFGGKPDDSSACAKFVEKCYDRATGAFQDAPGQGKPDVFTTAVGVMAVRELNLDMDRYGPGVLKYLQANAKNFEEVRIAAAGLEAFGQHRIDAWLKVVAATRNKDGTHGKGDGLARDTGGAVVTEMRLGMKPKDPATILKALQGGQRADGGFGKAGAKTSDLESSYRVMRAFHMLKDKPNVNKLKSFIASCRNKDGGYGVVPGDKSSAGGTYFAGIILHWLDEK